VHGVAFLAQCDYRLHVMRAGRGTLVRARLWGIFLVIAALCAGCASQPLPPVVAAVPPGQAKISITRVDEGPSWGAAAQIEINGAHVVELAPGQSYSGGVPPGPVSMTVSANMDIGAYTLKFKAVGGNSYAFQISKRGARIASALLAGAVGVIVETAASGEQSGAFQITQVGQ
jgi:hypothetical protein